MYDSGIIVSGLIEELQSEVDVALPISDAAYILWLNSLQFLLYSEVIQEQKRCVIENINDNTLINGQPIDIEGIKQNGEATIRFEDIYTVYATMSTDAGGSVQLIKSTPTNGIIFPCTFYKSGTKMAYNTPETPTKIEIIYFVKPEILTINNIDTKTISLPIEFLDLVKSKLRGEAYKVANEGGSAANWLNDYNVLLETFRAWIENRRAALGM